MADIKKVDLKSMNISEDKLRQLQQTFPEVFVEGNKVDFDKLKVALGENVEIGRERFGMNWPGKTDCFKIIQAPSVATLIPIKDESINFDITENLFIEGDNLEALKLLQKSYYGKIKMVYIDPPYNTGKEFIYPDNYGEGLDTYLRYSGQIDSQGRKYSTNTETDGRFHSKWLNMLFPRLYLARNLICEDGAICVSIGNEEVHHLRVLMNEIFGEENHRNTLAVRRYDKNLSRQFMDNGLNSLAVGFEYVLIYSKSEAFAMNPVFREASEERQSQGYWKGFWNASDRPTMRYECLGVKPEAGQWKWKESTAREAVANYKEYLEKFSNLTLEAYWEQTGKNKKFIRRNPEGKGKNFGVDHWIPPSTGILRTSSWNDILASESLSSLEIPFDSPKNEVLIKNLINLCCDEEAIVLDFFAGSCTVANAVLNHNIENGGNKRFICVQLPEPVEEVSETNKHGFKNIAEIGKERIRRAIKKIEINNIEKLKFTNDEIDLGFKIFKLSESNFKIWDGVIEPQKELVEKQLEMHIEHINPKSSQNDILFELLLKAGFELTTKIEKVVLAGKVVFSIEGGLMLICLDNELTLDVIKAMADKMPSRVICLDHGFNNNDQLKTNAVQIMKSKNVEDFRTI